MHGKDLRSQFGQLKTKRQNWESHWQEVADYCLPRRADVTTARSREIKEQKEYLMVQLCIAWSY